MRKVQLTMKEYEKYKVIKDLVDHSGNKHRAAIKLGLSIRQINRLIIVYKNEGKAGFVHKNRNRLPANSLPQELSNKIIALYCDKYQGFNFKHFSEKLNEVEEIQVSYKTVYNLLTKNGLFSPQEHKTTLRARSLKKIKKSKPDITKEDLIIAVNHEVDIANAHPRKARSKYFGEEVQMDASIHNWFGLSKVALHLAIDNATGIIVGGRFETQETLLGYYHVYKQILLNYGIPYKFLTDNRTVFHYEKLNRKEDSKDVLTQFGYACKRVGTSIETSSVSQYKGQIERANKTFQDRLVNELKLRNITDMDKANDYLINEFIPDFNKRFALDMNEFESVMEASPSEEKINLTLAILSTRKFDSGSTISYKNQKYQAFDKEGQLKCFKNKTECLVIKAFDNSLYVSVDDKVYALEKFIKHKNISENFDIENKPIKKKKKYIPDMSHPWKAASFKRYQENAHQFHTY